MDSTDAAMALYARGVDDAFKPLYAAVTPRLTGLFQRRLRDKTEIADLVQETFLRVHRARSTFVPGAAAMPWILTIARHLLADVHRAAARRDDKGSKYDRLECSSHHVPIDVAPTGEQMLIAGEAAALLGRAFDRLPETQRAALRLVKTEGLSVAQAAVALGTTTAGVKLRTHKACRRLRAELAAA
jgi:RNA polymerase sigma-70 factor (ECF subfamily)